MARKRPKEFINLDNSQDSYGLDSEDLSAYLSDSESNDFEDSEVHSSGGIESIQFAAYQQVLKNYHELKVLKRKQRSKNLLKGPKKFLPDFQFQAFHLFWMLLHLKIVKSLKILGWDLFCFSKSAMCLISL